MKTSKPWLLIPAFAALAACRTSPTTGGSALADASPGPQLSSVFAQNCASCHGALGKGLVGPSLVGLSYNTVATAVRHGYLQEMPAFSEAQYPSVTLQTDVTALNAVGVTANPNAPVTLVPTGSLEVVGSAADQLADAMHYTNESTGPKASLGLFAVEPFVLPYVKCQLLPDVNNPTGAQKTVCANVLISGSTEPGYRFADFGVCNDIRTQRPYNPLHTVREVKDDRNDPRLGDASFMGELAWVTSQIRSSGCVCCHDSTVDKRTAFWDISKNQIWTDQLDSYATEVFTGRVDSTAFGAYPPQLNHGFDRSLTGLPSTDPARMKAFFLKIADRLGTTQAQIASMPPLAPILADQLIAKPKACAPGVGVHADNTIHWAYLDTFELGSLFTNQDQLLGAVPVARYIYVLKPDSVTPLVPPNLDRPAGMIWRLDVARTAAVLFTGKVTYPTQLAPALPNHTTQAFPDDGSLPAALVNGQTYYLDAQIDMAFPAARCLFTYPAG